MRFSLILEDEYGRTIDMMQEGYIISEIDGLSPPNGTVTTSSFAGMNGSRLNNAFIEKRNIVINFVMGGLNIEKRRHRLYRIVKPSKYIKVRYRTKNIDVFADGYVETCNISNFSDKTSGQISIVCPDIYFYSIAEKIAEYSQIVGDFHFPFPENDEPFPISFHDNSQALKIVNDGDETGFTLKIFGGTAKNPTITNTDTGEYMQILCDIFDGDIITITTNISKKSAILERDGDKINIINRLVSGSEWLTLRSGENNFRFTVSNSMQGMKVQIIHRNTYLGV